MRNGTATASPCLLKFLSLDDTRGKRLAVYCAARLEAGIYEPRRGKMGQKVRPPEVAHSYNAHRRNVTNRIIYLHMVLSPPPR